MYMYQMATKYNEWPYNRPKGHKIYPHLPLQDPPNWDFWLEHIPPGNPAWGRVFLSNEFPNST
jgi:hypothetical protein